MDAEIATLREKIAEAKADEKALKANLGNVEATLSTEELKSSVVALQTEKEELLARLGPLRTGSVKPVAPEEKKKVDEGWRVWGRKATTRKKIALELWTMCTEEVEEGKTREEIWEEWGLEGDD
ncbi:hypothetical protein MMC21_001946 [Puttea exsequens]|nr:hypothetical protein [Puttea exsequens]